MTPLDSDDVSVWGGVVDVHGLLWDEIETDRES